jgi:hypothetical protein
MPWKYNPFTDALDQTGSGGGTSYIDGEVEYHSNLGVAVGSPAVNSAFLVRKGEGLYFISRKPAGIWVRELNNGNLDDWKYAGTFSDLYRDANFRILNNADVSKELAFDVSGVTTGTTRTLTVPNASGTISLQGHTHISANITDATSDETPNTIVKRDGYGNAKFNGIQVTDVTPPAGEVWLAGFDDSGTVAAISPSEARDFIGLDTDNNVTFGSLQNTPIGSTNRSTGSFTTLTATPAANTTALTSTGYSITGSNAQSFADLSGTWNTTGTPIALKTNLTITAAGANSMYADFQAGGYSQFGVARISGTSNALWLYNANSGTNTNGIGANYERGFLRWSGNIVQIGSEKAGTGTRRTLEFVTDGTARWRVGDGSITAQPSMLALGNSAIFGANDSYNVIIASGASGTWRTGVFGPNGSDTGYLAIGESLHLGLTNSGSSAANSPAVGGRESVARQSSTTISCGRIADSASRRAVPWRALSFASISGELIRWRAWAMLGSVPRSHSQTVARTGLPNTFRKYDGSRLSHTSTARVPSGQPLNDSRTPVAWQIASRSTSAGSALGRAWEKCRRSSSAPGAGGSPSASVQMSSCTVLSSSPKGRGSPYFMPRNVDDFPALPVPTSTILARREVVAPCRSTASKYRRRGAKSLPESLETDLTTDHGGTCHGFASP